MSIAVGLTPEGQAAVARMGQAQRRLIPALGRALRQGLSETETHIKVSLLSGGYQAGTRRDGELPVGLRSGSLRQAVTHEVDQPLSGYVGTPGDGPAARYAAVILGKGVTTITPRAAKHLWIPIGENLTRTGQARLSPREAMGQTDDKGRRMLRIFRSRAGNLVAATTAKVPGSRRKGLKLLFVLKDQVQVQGTDALAIGVQQRQPRIAQLLQDALRSTLTGSAEPGPQS